MYLIILKRIKTSTFFPRVISKKVIVLILFIFFLCQNIVFQQKCVNL